jgi:hypothetical protein
MVEGGKKGLRVSKINVEGYGVEPPSNNSFFKFADLPHVIQFMGSLTGEELERNPLYIGLDSRDEAILEATRSALITAGERIPTSLQKQLGALTDLSKLVPNLGDLLKNIPRT